MKRILALLSTVAAAFVIPACDETVNNTQVLGVTQPSPGSILVLNDSNTLFKINPANPSETESVVVVTGLGGSILQKIKYRPQTGQLIGITEDGRFFLIDPGTGHAGALFPLTFALAVVFSFDFHPTTGTLSLQTNADHREFVDPDEGSLAAPSPPSLNPSVGIVAVAFAPGGVLYGIGAATGTGTLYTIAANSTVATVGDIFAMASNVDFDIAGNGTAYAVISPSGQAGRTGLYTLNLTTANATRLDWVQPANLRSLTVVP